MFSKGFLIKKLLPALTITCVSLIIYFLNIANQNNHQLNLKPALKFNLQTHNGKNISEKDLIGSPSIIFFGFTYCPDICPSSLMLLSNLIDELKKDQKKIKYYFVTVDPERDTKESLKKYLSNFNANITGVLGKHSELKKLYQSFDIYAEKVKLKKSYTIDHTASFILLDSKARKVGTMIHEGFKELIVIDNYGKIKFPKKDLIIHLKKILGLL
jgi:protein SCO1/2